MTYWHGAESLDQLLEARGWTRAGNSWRPPLPISQQQEAADAGKVQRAFSRERAEQAKRGWLDGEALYKRLEHDSR